MTRVATEIVALCLRALDAKRNGSSMSDLLIQSIQMNPRVRLKSVTFSDGIERMIGPDDVVILVGPNNSGKSAALKGISQRLSQSEYTYPPIKDIKLEKEG